jgi:hypothetical protein
MEAATFISRRIWNLNRLAILDDKIALNDDGIDVLDAGGHAELLEGSKTAWLKKFANDAVGFCERTF